jgi:hypothetical protein
MGIKVRWDNSEHTIIRWDFEGRWTDDDFYRAVQATGALAGSVSHVVYGLGIVGGIGPANLLDVLQAVASKWPDNIRRLILVGKAGTMKHAFSLLSRVAGKMPKVEFFDKLDDAYERITLLYLKEVYVGS